MQFSPSLSLVRLQELKLWQGSYENLIQKSKTQSQPTDNDYVEGVAVLDNSNANDSSSERDPVYPKDWDKKAISPCKPFEQLLEEKLAEDKPKAMNTKPKKPFLKKGQGLARFKMGPTPPTSSKNKELSSKRVLEYQKNTPVSQQKAPPTVKKGILKNSNPCYHQYVDYLTPLTVPDFVRPRGTWKNVLENSEQISDKKFPRDNENHGDEHEEVENYEEFRLSLGFGENEPDRVRKIDGVSDKEELRDVLFAKSSSRHTLDVQNGDVGMETKQTLSKRSLENFNKDILEKINEYAQKYFQPSKTYLSNDIPKVIAEMSTPRFKHGAGDLTLYEERMEQELKVFEELEKKVENSSFCSTNTSVANLLSSTPHKAENAEVIDKMLEKKDNVPIHEISDNVEFTNDRHDNIQVKLLEVAEKADVLQQFLMRLRKMDKNVPCGDLTVDSDLTRKSTSADTSFSEENTRWSTRSPSLVDNYTEYDTTCQNDSWKKIDAGVNTSFDRSGLDETVKKWEPCKECEQLRSKFSDTKMTLSEIRSENLTLKTDIRDLEKKYEQTKKEAKKEKENYEKKFENLQEELNQERKKLAREKAYFETYVKEAQNRATKKEREEITQLKQDLADAKELLKLKDSKNGASQARLRTQIKQQEKEISELKITVDKLQKENAKLNASQKLCRRPQEVKMLHEINKNLSKLTEETFKNQMNKSGNNDHSDEKNTKRNTLERKKSACRNEEGSKENEGNEKNTDNKHVHNTPASKDTLKIGSAALDLTSSEAITIEKQYEHIFGGFSSPRNSNVSTNLEKTEKILPDGSTEITYTNGNFKTISADGQIVKIKYFNGDSKETNLWEQIIRYHYASTDTWHIQYADGTETMEYKDGQKSKKYMDGKTEVTYPDGSLRVINPDGTEEQQYPDGRKTIKNLQGEQIILLPNGQREIHTEEYKRREYPDGTIRTLRKDGSVETVYANGRVRLKDPNGVLVMDTQSPPA